MRALRVVTAILSVALLGLGSPSALLRADEAAAPEAQRTTPELTPEEKADAEIGRKASEEIEKEFKVVADSPDLPRLQGIIAQLRPFTEKPTEDYTVKILEAKEINALSLPGGYLYVTKGLVIAAESEHELAAVLAHEMAHICLRHARRLMEKDDKYNQVFGPVVLAAILAQKSGINPGEIAAIGSLVKLEAVNHYGREAELEADRAAVRYLQTSRRYHPVAVLTVVEGLARIEQARPRPDLGVYQTHPLAQERVAAVAELLAESGIPIERGRVTKGLSATVAAVMKEEREIGELRLGDQVVFQPAAELDGRSPLARAEASARLLNPMLLANLALVDIMRVDRDGVALVTARGEPVLTITPADAAFHKTSVDALAKQAMQAIEIVFYTEKTKRAY